MPEAQMKLTNPDNKDLRDHILDILDEYEDEPEVAADEIMTMLLEDGLIFEDEDAGLDDGAEESED
jgi:hypothetical protein